MPGRRSGTPPRQLETGSFGAPVHREKSHFASWNSARATIAYSARRGTLTNLRFESGKGRAMRGGVIVAAISLLVVACSGSDPAPTTTPAPTAPPTATESPTATIGPVSYEVTYRIEADPDAVVQLTYANGRGGTSQEDGIVTPWELTVTMQSGDVAYISAQNRQYRSEISCYIEVNGKVGASSTSEGTFVVTTCSGRLP